MCGISAIVDPRPGADPTAALRRMHDLLAHRGPDGEGMLWLDGALGAHGVRGAAVEFPSIGIAPFAAAFRWLRIQDLDPAASQPMPTPDGSLWVLFNGAIYNHAELREELRGQGFEPRTKGDTEVILAAYRRWGAECFSRLEGMWAILLVDVARRRLVISRDRLGIKPLYYSLDGGRLLVASEAKAVALAREGGVHAEPFRAHEFLRGLPPQSPGLTYFRDVHPVPAGTWAELDLASGARPALEFRKFWDLADHVPLDEPESRFSRRREEFEALLRASVRAHASAAVEVGSLLSGGFDSSTLARMLADQARLEERPAPRTFSIIYEDPEMSEWPYMQMVLAQGGLQGTRHVLTPAEAWQAVPKVVWAEGQPLLGQDIIAQYHAYRLAREHRNTVVLDGQGADEVLAGLPLHEAQMFPEMLRRGQWIRFAMELRARMRRDDCGLRRALGTYVVAPIERRRMERGREPRYAWLDGSQADSTRYGPGRSADEGPGGSDLSRLLFRLVRHTNLPQVLTLQDHASMSHGIESRVPFLDHRLVEFAFRLPDRFKVGNGLRKRILVETARPILPRAVVERRDKRMFVSKAGWMRLRETRSAELLEMAASEELARFGLLKPRRVGEFVSDYLAGRHDDHRAVWRLHTFRHWLRLFQPAS